MPFFFIPGKRDRSLFVTFFEIDHFLESAKQKLVLFLRGFIGHLLTPIDPIDPFLDICEIFWAKKIKIIIVFKNCMKFCSILAVIFSYIQLKGFPSVKGGVIFSCFYHHLVSCFLSDFGAMQSIEIVCRQKWNLDFGPAKFFRQHQIKDFDYNFDVLLNETQAQFINFFYYLFHFLKTLYIPYYAV